MMMKTGRLTSTLAILAVAILASHSVLAAEGPQRHAVLIGINNYADPGIPGLKYAESDAKAIYDTLTDPSIGQFPKDNVKLLLGKDASNDNIKAALAGLRGVSKDDLVVIFFSGHGVKVGEEAFWVTQAAQAKALDATALSNTDIRKWLGQIPSERLVILLDCCYAASTVKKSMAEPAKLFGEFPGKGRVTIAGAAENQEALEYPDKKSGVFTYFLVDGLRGAADTNADGVVTFDELWTYLGGNVRKVSVKQGGLHEPVIITESGATPQFLLTYNPAVKSVAEEQVKVLRKLFDDGRITGAQFDMGRKALSEPALESESRQRREIFMDLAAGKLDAKYLQGAVDKIVALTPAPPLKVDPNAAVSGPAPKPTLAIVPFVELGKAKDQDLGKILAEKLLEHFQKDYEVVDQIQLAAFLKQDDLTIAELTEVVSKPTAKGLTKAVKMRGVRYLVVGSISGPPDGTLSITARICDWQTGQIEAGRVAQASGQDWRDLTSHLDDLAARLTGRASGPAGDGGKAAKELVLDLGNSVKMKLVLIPSGKFMMGSPDGEKDRSADEGPQREVTISKPFHMGVTAVTQEQYEQVMGKNPSNFKGATNPVETVSWDDAVEFCKKLSTKTGKSVRLPTEAQWEYACRAGSKTRFGFGDDEDKLADYAWYSKNSDSKTHPVGQKKPNDFGLYDMHGNVWQWCADWYDEKYYANADKTDPAGPASGSYRVLRGGGFTGIPQYCRSAYRLGGDPDDRGGNGGFRVVAVAAGVD